MSNALKKSQSPVSTERRKRGRNAPSFPSRRGEKLVEGLTKAELICKYEQKVRFIASRMATQLPSSVDVDDLVSVGFIGLMDAADKFNSAKGVKFATYAEFRIRGAILDELRNQDWVPHCARGRAKQIEKAYSHIERETGERPSEEAVSEKLGVSRSRLQKMKENVGNLVLVSYDAQEAEAAQQPHEKREGADPFAHVIQNDARAYLENLFKQLGEEERIVLSCYYFRGLNLREISQILDLSESRISQIHTQAIFKLKQLIQETGSPKSMFTWLLEAS